MCRSVGWDPLFNSPVVSPAELVRRIAFSVGARRITGFSRMRLCCPRQLPPYAHGRVAGDMARSSVSRFRLPTIVSALTELKERVVEVVNRFCASGTKGGPDIGPDSARTSKVLFR